MTKFKLSLLTTLITMHVLPAMAQTTNSTEIQEVTIYSNSVGFNKTRANIKITEADMDRYPTGVSADKILERVSGIQVGSSNAFGGDGFESTINMRGFGKDSIGFSVDGIPNGRTTLGGGSVPTRLFDSSNLSGVDVSQSAGSIGAPSNQALVGHINYLTKDPEKTFGARVEGALGSSGYKRAYGIINTGEIAQGLTSYLSVAKDEYKNSYVNNPVGQNTKSHVDIKINNELGGGNTLKFKSSYNQREETSGTNIVSLTQFKANPKVDGYSDVITGVASADRAYREFKGNPRTDYLTYLDGKFNISNSISLNAKAYVHKQDGIGKEAGLGNSGFPGLNGSATSLYFRANNFNLDRSGFLAEFMGQEGALINWKAGAWSEDYTRTQKRNWQLITLTPGNYSISPDVSATSENKKWDNSIRMYYATNESSFIDGTLKVDYGVSYLENKVDYNAPVQSSRTSGPQLNFVNKADVNSGLLPKLGLNYALDASSQVFMGFSKNAASVTDATLEANAKTTIAAAGTVQKMDSANVFDFGYRSKGNGYAYGVQGFVIGSKETLATDTAGPLSPLQNIDQGRKVRGVEFTYSGKIDQVNIYTSYTIQKSEYDLNGANADGYLPAGFIKNGADLVGIPNQNLYLQATWKPTQNFKIASNVRYMSSRMGYYANPRIANSGADERLPANTLVGLNATYTTGSITYGANIENLTNKSYISGIAPELLGSPASFGRYFIGAPRTFSLWIKADI